MLFFALIKLKAYLFNGKFNWSERPTIASFYLVANALILTRLVKANDRFYSPNNGFSSKTKKLSVNGTSSPLLNSYNLNSIENFSFYEEFGICD